jgi:hypothetical protein
MTPSPVLEAQPSDTDCRDGRGTGRSARAGNPAYPTDLHRYPLPTCEEDWRALQTSDRTDVWAPVKFVRLSADVRTEMAMSALARSRRSRIPFARSAEDAIRHPSGR